MLKKLSIVTFFIGIVLVLLYLGIPENTLDVVKPFLTKDQTSKPANLPAAPKQTGDDSVFKDKDVLNILLLGIDRRNKSQTGFNTDVMILMSVNFKTKKILFTSVPRDLWINGNKINALYTVFGYDTLKDAFEKIVGMKVDGYIRCDFEDFRWLADSIGGIPVNIERTFTDHTFPNNSDTDILSVTFTEGLEVMDGQRALTFARSRKGDNGEGSDLMRAKRQHLLLQGIAEGISQQGSSFWPMDIEKFFGAVTLGGRMLTTLSLEDAYYLWRYYENRSEFEVESFVVDDTYVYHPGMYPASEFHAWVFISRDESFATLHKDVQDKLNKTFIDPITVESSESQATEL